MRPASALSWFLLLTLPTFTSLVAAMGCGVSDDSAATDAGPPPADTGGGGSAAGGGGGEAPQAWPVFFEETPPRSLAHGAAYDQMTALVARPDFNTTNLGNVADYATTTATTPTHPEELASLYLETDGFNTDVQAVRDLRAGVVAVDDIGLSIAQAFVQDLTVGAASAAPPDSRGGVRYVGHHAVRSLDTYLLLAALGGIGERSGAGFDRALALLYTPDGEPQALGRLFAEADAMCGGEVMADLQEEMEEVRVPFAAALEAHGELDPLDRLTIPAGVCPEYDAFILTADRLFHQGLALNFLSRLRAPPLDALDQADLMAAYGALSARLAATNAEGDALIGQTLDQADAAAIIVAGTPESPGMREIITMGFGVSCAL